MNKQLYYLFSVLSFFLLLLSTPLYSDAATVVGGTISANTTWTAANSPYVVNSPVTVPNGVTLTVEPGVIVKFGQQTKIDVSGTLNATGSSGSPIYFTDIRDDTVGGDTNGDGNASSPAPAWWWGINIWDGGSAVLDYCTVRYSLGYSIYHLTTGGGVYKTGTGSLTLTNSTVSDTGGAGVWLSGTTVNATIANNTFQNNGSYGISMDGTGNSVTITGNTISGNTSGAVVMDPYSSWVPVDATNVLSGPIVINSGALTHDAAWAGGQVYYLPGPITVNTGVTLGIGAGAIVKFGSQSRFDVYGSLSAIGNSGSRIYFTDYRDDTVGGDTNGDGSASSPAPAWWWGINMWDGGSATLDYCNIRYSLGYSIYHLFTGGGVYKVGTGSLTLTNSTVSDTGGAGVWLSGTTVNATIANNTFQNNGSYGISMDGTGNSVTITGNTISGNTSGAVVMDPYSSWVPVDATNVLSGPIVINSGALTHDAAWAGGQVYYLPGPITVNTGVTLGIGAGAIVKFGSQSKIDVSGTLNAVGNSGNRIYFTDYRDDSIGGDTNGDGNASSPAPAWWWGINMWDGGSAVLNYCTVRYSLGYSIYHLTTGGGVYKTGTGSLTLTNSTVSDTGGAGVWISGSTAIATLSGNSIQNNVTGLLMDSSPGSGVTLKGNSILDNTGSGITLSNSSPTIMRNTISGNQAGIVCTAGANPVVGGSPGLGNDLVGNIGLAVSNDTPSVTVNARYNWWGSSVGPTLNAANGVSLYIDYGNFLAGPSGQDVIPGLVSLWKGEGNALDSIGTNHGTLQGGTTFATGKVGQAFSFNGQSQYVEMPAEVGDFGTNPFTVDFWILSNNDGSNSYLLGKSHPDGGLGWDIRLNANSIRVVGVNGWGFNITSEAVVTTGAWHHLALVATDSAIGLYIDGALKGNSPRSVITSTTNPFRIGYTTNYGGPPFDGLIDEVKIFNRALSSAEVSRLAGTYPDAFSFTSQTGVAINTVVESNVITVAGITNPASISITGGEYSVSTNGGSTWSAYSSSVPSTVSLNNQVKVRQTSSVNYSTTTTATLTIGGVSAGFSVTTMPMPVYTLTVTKVGNGTVTAIPDGGSTDMLSWNGNTGTADFNSGIQVSLAASAGTGYTFYGWSGACTGNGTPCLVAIDSAKSLTATFDDYTDPGPVCNNPPFKINGTMANYPTIKDAYDGLAGGETLQIRALNFMESGLNLDQSKSIGLSGGYDCGFTANPGFTIIQNSMTIFGGTVTVEKLTIQ